MTNSTKLQILNRAGALSEPQFAQANKDLDVAEKTKEAHEAADDITGQLSQLRTLGNNVFSPIQTSQKVEALKARLAPLVLASAPSKRFTPDAVNTMINPLLGSFFTGKSTYQQLNQQLHAIIDTAADKPQTLGGLDGFGIQVPKYEPKVLVKSPDGVIGKISKVHLQNALNNHYTLVK